MVQQPNKFNPAPLTFSDRLRFVKAFDLSINDPNTPILERIRQLNEYQNRGERKYYEARFTSHNHATLFRITEHKMDRRDNEVTIIGSITDSGDQSKRVTAKIFPNLLTTFLMSMVTIAALFLLISTIGQLSPEQSLIALPIILVLVIISLFQWLNVAVDRQSFDQFLQEWLATGSTVQQTSFEGETLEQAA
jgi:hypothetical protein